LNCKEEEKEEQKSNPTRRRRKRRRATTTKSGIRDPLRIHSLGIEDGRPGWEAVEMGKILACRLVVWALAVFLGLSVAASEVLDFDSSATVVPAFLWTDQR
jgi:hypothetical protein